MGKSYISLNLNGFDELIRKIDKAGGTINGAVDACMRESAKIQNDKLKETMQKKNVDTGLINRMPPPEIKWEGNSCEARVGYKKGKYDPDNPSDGYKAVFINYGTPHRKEHGKVEARGFVKEARKKAMTPIKKKQKETLEGIMKELGK